MVQMEADDVKLLDRAEAAAETSFMKMIARGSMAIAIPVLSAIILFVYSDIKYRISEARQEIKEFKTETVLNLGGIDDKNDLLSSRVTVVETNQERSKDRERRDDEQARRLDDMLRSIQATQTQLATQVSALTATVEALKLSIERRSSIEHPGEPSIVTR